MQTRAYAHIASWQLWCRFVVSALGVLLSGYAVARAGDVLATSLPEVSTTVTAVRLGAYGMAVANIFGTNALEVALFFVADLAYRGGLIFSVLNRSAIFLAALGIVMTCLYLWGLLERRDQTVLGMGVDSAAALLLYVMGMVLFYSMF